MAQALLSARLTARGVTAPVRSAGTLGDGRRPPPEVIELMAVRGIDVSGHRGHAVTSADLAQADLVLGLTRQHVRHAVVLRSEAWPRTFTLRELLRRGGQAGPRRPGEPLSDWLARSARDRDRRDLLGGGPADDVADPSGGPADGYRATAGLLDQLTRDLAELGWPASDYSQ
jgi:protein-tyrosine phosphatase